MSWTKVWCGRLLIAAVWACLLALIGFLAVAGAIYYDLRSPGTHSLTRNSGLEMIARQFYLAYFRPGWQDRAGYVDFDPELVYVPRPGKAQFRGPEFDVDLSFDAKGLRQQPAAPDATGGLIVITGDSFSMGWGLRDDQTFSAILASRYKFRTVNASVSSYGTARELLRLRRLGLLQTASAVVIAYAVNDADENHSFVDDPAGFIQKRDPQALWKTLARYNQQEVKFPLIVRLTYDNLKTSVGTNGGWATVRRLFTHVPIPEVAKTPRGTATMASDFIAVLDLFPELARIPVVLTEINDYGQKTDFLAQVSKLSGRYPNLKIAPLPLSRADFFRFDNHPTPAAHEKIAAALATMLRSLGLDSAASSRSQAGGAARASSSTTSCCAIT